jgi:hypothetical protein
MTIGVGYPIGYQPDNPFSGSGATRWGTVRRVVQSARGTCFTKPFEASVACNVSWKVRLIFDVDKCAARGVYIPRERKSHFSDKLRPKQTQED